MNDYGYIGEVEQSFGNNKGILTPTDIYNLSRDDKYTNYGQLELITSFDISSGSATHDFQALKEDEYNVHLLMVNNYVSESGTEELTLQLYESGVLNGSNDYEFNNRINRGNGTMTSRFSTGYSMIRFSGWSTYNNGFVNNGYIWFYNLGDANKRSFWTHQWVGGDTEYGQTYASFHGSGVLDKVSVVPLIAATVVP